MQRSKQADVEQDSPESLPTTLSRAAGWLNPFNLIRSGASKVMATSAVLLNMIGSADGSSCFRANNTLYQLACPLQMEDSLIAKLHDACNIEVLSSCGDRHTHNIFLEKLSFGETPFGASLCEIRAHYQTDLERLNACVVDILKKNAVSGYGTLIDVMATTGIIIGGIAVVAGLSYGAYRLYTITPWYYSREAYKKYDPMTQALAANDVALLKEINQLAVDANCTLPKDLALLLLKKVHKDSDQPINGVQANGIRFFDTVGRQRARVAARKAAWEEIKAERMIAWHNNQLLDDVSEDEGLVAAEVGLLIPKNS